MNIFTRMLSPGFVLVLILSFTAYAQVPIYNWSVKGGGTGKDYGSAIIIEPNGNFYVTGEFTGTAAFAPGVSLTSAGNVDFFLVKFDSVGNAIWGQKGGGTLTDRGYGVAIDNEEKLIVSGHYFGTATFGSYTVTSAGNLDCMTMKYDTSGNILWFKEGKSVSQVSSRSVVTDNLGNSYVAGYFGSATVDTVRFDNVTLHSNGGRDIFLVKYNSAGEIQWGISAGGNQSGEEANDVAVDNFGNVYITGMFVDTASFGNTTLYSHGGTDVFIAKYSPNGNFISAVNAGGPAEDIGTGIVINGSELYISGRYDSTATFGTTTIFGQGDFDAFVAKYDTSLSMFSWVKSGGGATNDYASDLALDNEGKILVIGYFTGTAVFDTATVISAGLDDIYFMKLSSSGSMDWIKVGSGSDLGRGMAIAIDGGNNCIGTGYFKVSNTFGVNTLTSAGLEDVFVVKIGNNPIPVELTSFTASVVNNSVVLQWSTASEINNSGFAVERSSDKILFSQISFVKGNGTTTEKSNYTFEDNTVSSGIYYYRLKQIDFNGNYEYSNIAEVSINQPYEFEVFQNYPNPFNPSTTIKFNLPASSLVTISIFNAIGQKLELLMQKEMAAGHNEVSFNGSGLSSGIYFYEVKAAGSDGSSYSSIKKMTLLK